MDLTTEAGVLAYLREGPYPQCTSVARLADGSSGFVYRAHQSDPAHPPSLIVKHVEGYAARSKQWKLDQGRMDFEHRALDLFSSFNLSDASDDAYIPVRVPRVHFYDESQHVLILEDVGEVPNLKAWVQDSVAIDTVANVGAALGRYLAKVHDATAGNAELFAKFNGNDTAKYLSGTLYFGGLPAAAERWGFKQDYFRQAAAVGEKEVMEASEVLTLGDFWTGNILVVEQPKLSLAVVDLELAKPGTAAFDIGQMAAEMYCLAAFRSPERGRRLLEAFLTAYRQTRSTAGVDPAKVAIRIGVHLFVIMPMAWSGEVKSQEAVRKELDMAAELIRMGVEDDKAALEGSIVKSLMMG